MLVKYLISSIILGFIVAIPPGSVTVVGCQRALQFGFKNSIFFSLGSCTSDIFYITLVYLGVAHLISNNQYFKIILWVICAIILTTIGAVSIFSIKKNESENNNKTTLYSNRLSAFISGILITLSNPMTIVGWIVVAGNFFLIWNEKFPISKNYGLITILFIIVGVLLWFAPLFYIVSRLRKKLNNTFKKWLIIMSNICLIIFGFIAFYYAIISIHDIIII